jgi:hypothetical protein
MRYIATTVIVLACASRVFAQGETVGSAAPTPDYRAGWTFTPIVGIAETYDNNITLFGNGSADGLNNDYVMTFFPSANLHFEGAHTQFGTGYGGSFLGYHQYNSLDRWDQHGDIELRREETAHLKWFAHASGSTRPETDLIDLGGIPYRHTGATELSGRGGFTYLFDARNSIDVTSSYQDIRFQRSDLAAENLFLRGGNIFDNLFAYRHRLNERLAIGADYSFRRALVVGDLDHFNLHGAEAAVDYEISEVWSLSGAGGVMYMQPTTQEPDRTGPAYRLGVTHHRGLTSFHVSYVDSYIPSFGFGGIIRSRELAGGFRSQLFNSRHFYTEESVSLRDDAPVVATDLQLPLRSLRGYAILGWEPDRWVRFEVFYARVDQTSLRPGGELSRDRIGFQIVASKPMRIQ